MFLAARRCLPPVILYSLCICGLAASQTPEPIGTSARKAWEDYENVARMWSYRIHSEYSTRDEGKSSDSASSATVRSNGRCVLIEETSPTDPQAQECRVVNSTYLFTARQPPGSKSWGLTGVLDHSSIKSPGAFGRISMRDDIETGSVLAPVSCDTMAVRRLIDHPCCKTTRFAQTAEGVEWLFTIDQAKRPERMRLVEGGRILFDPSNHWVIKDSMTENRNGAGGISTIRQTMAYLPGPHGYPILREIKGRLETDDKTFQTEFHTTFEMISQVQPPADREFTLAAYGIPDAARHATSVAQMAFNERVGAVPAPQIVATHWYWWLMVIAGAFVAVGAILLGIGRLRRAA